MRRFAQQWAGKHVWRPNIVFTPGVNTICRAATLAQSWVHLAVKPPSAFHCQEVNENSRSGRWAASAAQLSWVLCSLRELTIRPPRRRGGSSLKNRHLLWPAAAFYLLDPQGQVSSNRRRTEHATHVRRPQPAWRPLLVRRPRSVSGEGAATILLAAMTYGHTDEVWPPIKDWPPPHR